MLDLSYMLANMLDLSYMLTQHLVMEKLGYSRICAKYEPKLLKESQKEELVRINRLWEQNLPNDPTWFDNVIMTDECWTYLYPTH